MKTHLTLLTAALLFLTSFSLLAQNTNVAPSNSENRKATVILEGGKQVLVLHTMSPNHDIKTTVDNTTWDLLDDLLALPLGSTVILKDINGNDISVSHGNVNSTTGLLFLSGPRFVAITQVEYTKLRARER